MNIWNKVLLGIIFVGFVGWLFLATKAMNVQHTWRTKFQQHEKELELAKQKKIALINGSENELGLRDAKREFHKLTVGRGRVWNDCVPQGINVKQHAKTGAETVDILIDTATPEHGVELKTTLYIFEQADAQGQARYLGQFVVTNLAPGQLQIEPSMSPSPKEIQAFADSKVASRLWSLHEIMPDDNHEVYTDWDSAEYLPLLPEAARADYEKEAERALRDYRVLFNGMHQTRSRNIAQIAALTQDVASLESAVASATVQKQFRTQELAELGTRLSAIQSDRDAVEAHRLAVQQKSDEIKAAVARSIESNEAILGKITQLQVEATQRIDARTRRMAQANPTR